ncbi:MAG: efflux RND transporter periplasmic adaptor subunit [Burkholderiales bacterium]|nr:efflux RND transporter periplasmic adaptor subunit [Burkholderiales bacterium]
MSPCRSRLAHVVPFLAVAALVAACSKEVPPPPRPAPEVAVVTIEPRTIPYTPTFVAQTESSRQVNIVARVSGFLDSIAYSEGDLVKQGQLMFKLDTKPFLAQLNAAKGELQAQQARLDTAQVTYRRVKPLADQDALPQMDLDRAKGELDAARAAVFSAQAKVEEATLNLGYATITSPVTGVASRSLQRQGAYVNALADSANLTYVAALDPIWVNFSISQNQMAHFQELAEKHLVVAPRDDNFDVEIILPNGTPYAKRGQIGFADPSFSPDTGAFLVRAVIPNPRHELRPGMFVTARLLGAVRPNAIVVPQLAVQQGSNGHAVFVVGANGVAEVRPVIVGDYVGDKDIVIQTGLNPGDRVIVDGMMRVVPGQPVRIAATSATPAAAAPAGGAAPAAGGATAGKPTDASKADAKKK